MQKFFPDLRTALFYVAALLQYWQLFVNHKIDRWLLKYQTGKTELVTKNFKRSLNAVSKVHTLPPLIFANFNLSREYHPRETSKIVIRDILFL